MFDQREQNAYRSLRAPEKLHIKPKRKSPLAGLIVAACAALTFGVYMLLTPDDLSVAVGHDTLQTDEVITMQAGTGRHYNTASVHLFQLTAELKLPADTVLSTVGGEIAVQKDAAMTDSLTLSEGKYQLQWVMFEDSSELLITCKGESKTLLLIKKSPGKYTLQWK